MKVPSSLDLGLILFDLSELRRGFQDLLLSLVSELKSELLKHFHLLLLEEEKQVVGLLELLGKVPNNLTQYIEMSQYLSGGEFSSLKESFQNNNFKLKFLFKVLEDLHILIQSEDLAVYFASFAWLNKVVEAEKLAKTQLLEKKGKFKAIVQSENTKISEEFKVKRVDIQKLQEKKDLESVYQNANQCKSIMQELLVLRERAKKSNENEEYLGYEVTDFNGLN